MGQPCNVRRVEELTLAFDLTRVAVRPRRGGRFGGRNARARSPRSSNAFRFRCGRGGSRRRGLDDARGVKQLGVIAPAAPKQRCAEQRQRPFGGDGVGGAHVRECVAKGGDGDGGVVDVGSCLGAGGDEGLPKEEAAGGVRELVPVEIGSGAGAAVA